jgi:hypothetical protein
MPALRYLHIGDCNFRRMDFAHDTQAPPGYPMQAAHELLNLGIGVEFSHYFAVNYEWLPTREELIRRTRLSGPPDVISVHIGGNYTRWIVIPDTVRTMQVRVEIGRRLGRHATGGYRFIRPFVGFLGRPAARYYGVEAYEEFLKMLHDIWPDAQIVVVTPLPRLKPHRKQGPIGDRVENDIRATVERIDAELLDTGALIGTEPKYRGMSGYHLNGNGSEVIGRQLARQVVQQQTKQSSPRRPASLVKALAAATLRF